ncbi:MAG: hypothetical protein H6Q61_1304 [Firmicutes bacterium]|nr:hypothetical protein [Bacillota bacterium]
MPKEQVKANDAVFHHGCIAECCQGGDKPEEDVQENFLPEGAISHAEGAEEVVKET